MTASALDGEEATGTGEDRNMYIPGRFTWRKGSGGSGRKKTSLSEPFLGETLWERGRAVRSAETAQEINFTHSKPY